MDPICLTLEVFQPVSGWLKLVAASKTDCGTESGTDEVGRGGERELLVMVVGQWSGAHAHNLHVRGVPAANVLVEVSRASEHVLHGARHTRAVGVDGRNTSHHRGRKHAVRAGKQESGH